LELSIVPCQEITLDDIAAVGGESRFHMSRAFGDAAGARS